MKAFHVFALLLAALLVSPSLAFQDKDKDKDKDKAKDKAKKDDPKPPKKIKGTLPLGWGKLGLTAAQKQSVYKVQSEYAEKIEALQAMIEKLKKERNEKREAILTPAQLKALKEGK